MKHIIQYSDFVLENRKNKPNTKNTTELNIKNFLKIDDELLTKFIN